MSVTFGSFLLCLIYAHLISCMWYSLCFIWTILLVILLHLLSLCFIDNVAYDYYVIFKVFLTYICANLKLICPTCFACWIYVYIYVIFDHEKLLYLCHIEYFIKNLVFLMNICVTILWIGTTNSVTLATMESTHVFSFSPSIDVNVRRLIIGSNHI